MKQPAFIFSGIEHCKTQQERRHILLSNQMAVGLFLVALLLDGLYFGIYGVTGTFQAILATGVLSLIPIFLNNVGRIQVSRVWLCSMPVIVAMALSVIAKKGAMDVTRDYDYFSYRIILISLAILPMVLFSNKESRSMIACLSVSLLLLIFFDPIHAYFGAANPEAAISGMKYYFVNAVVVIALAIILGSVLFLKALAESNEKLNEALYQRTEQTKQRLIQYQNCLISLAHDFKTNAGGNDFIYRRLCRETATILKVNRVSIWILSEHNSVLTRTFLYENGNETADRVELNRDDYPSYFMALESQPFVLAHDSHTHPFTKEFSKTYLKPLGIFSMLDCPIVEENQVTGVICCEHQKEPRTWLPEEVLFVQSLGDLLSLHRQNEEIRRLLFTVQKQNLELEEKTHEIKSMNENLESLVRHRTTQLEERNKRLIEYGFINSHLLRAPLARIMGLAHLLEREVKPSEQIMISAMMDASTELDIVIKRITEVLNSDQELSEETIRREINQLKQK